MLNYISSLMSRLSFSKPVFDKVLGNYKKLEKNAQKPLNELIDHYKSTNNLSRELLKTAPKHIANVAKIHEYEAQLVISLALCSHLEDLYAKNGIPESVFIATMLDIKYKTEECMLVKGVCGIFVLYWFDAYYNLERFCLGRLQFEKYPLGFDCEINGKTYTKDTVTLKFHIPRSQKPLTYESCDQAFSMAREFFDMPDALFTCGSWLLYPKYETVFKQGTNLYIFRNRFKILSVSDDPETEYPDMWRLFDMDYTGNFDDYPENSSLHKNMKAYLKSGGSTGTAYGVITK